MNYIARYSLCKCIRLTFAHDVVGAVDIRADHAPILGAVQALSLAEPLAAKDMHFLLKRELERVQQERDILKKAVAIFSRPQL